jgi:hypothetical protein
VITRAREYAGAGAQTLVFSPSSEGAERRTSVDLFVHEVLPALREG